MTSFLTLEGENCRWPHRKLRKKTVPARPSSMSLRAFLRGQALLGPLRQLMRHIHKSVAGGHADIARTSLFVADDLHQISAVTFATT